jgi:hypothetical protein
MAWLINFLQLVREKTLWEIYFLIIGNDVVILDVIFTILLDGIEFTKLNILGPWV